MCSFVFDEFLWSQPAYYKVDAMLKIHFLKFADRWLGAALASLLPRPLSPSPDVLEPHSFLLIRPGGIGDAVHLEPAIHALYTRFPQAAIDILAEGRNSGIFPLCLGIRRVYRYDHPAELMSVLCNSYDVIIDTEQWHRLSAVVVHLVRAPVKIGFATNNRRRLFTHGCPYHQEDYEVISFLRLLNPLGVPTVGFTAERWLHIPAAVRDAFVSLLPPHDQRPVVVIFPGASIAEKRWGFDRFRSVAEWCLGLRLQVVLIGGEGDRSEAAQIASGIDVVNLVGRTSLLQTSEIIEKSAVVVSGDSGVLHLAAGLGCPSVALFGPSSTVKWAPRDPRHVVLHRNLSCSPCSRFGYTPPCPIDARCMKEITVENVTSAIGTLLTLQPEPRSQ